MDLDDQELLYTLLLHKKLTQKDMIKLKKYYTDKLKQTQDKEERKTLLTNINRIERELGDIER